MVGLTCLTTVKGRMTSFQKRTLSLEPTRVRWNDDQVMKTMRQVYVVRCKAVQVRGCLLVPHADIRSVLKKKVAGVPPQTSRP